MKTNKKKVESLAKLCCSCDALTCETCSGQRFCTAYDFATKAISNGYGIERDAVSSFIGQVLAMSEPDKAKAMKQRFKKLYRG